MWQCIPIGIASSIMVLWFFFQDMKVFLHIPTENLVFDFKGFFFWLREEGLKVCTLFFFHTWSAKRHVLGPLAGFI